MLTTEDGRQLNPGVRLAAGGQGEVFDIPSMPDLVFKRYFPSALARDNRLADRIAAMVASPPAAWKEPGTGHVMLAWPQHLVFEDGRFVGFLMPRIDTARTVELHQVTNPTDRHRATGATAWMTGFSWPYLVNTAMNLALAADVLHQSGTVIGDFNERNVRVWPDARITLIDCDSMQITGTRSGQRFLCTVGRPDATAPELHGLDLRTTVRAPSSDLFALAIHLHQLLMEGDHPFDGVWHASGDKPKRQALAWEGLWVYAGDPRLTRRPAAVGVEVLPPEFASLFRRALVDGAKRPAARPAAGEWQRELSSLASALVRCPQVPAHSYYRALPQCPWCEHVRRTGAPPLSVQQPLPPATPIPIPRPLVPAPPQRPAVPPPPARRGSGGLVAAGLIVAVLLIVGIALAHGAANPPQPSTSGTVTDTPTPVPPTAPPQPVNGGDGGVDQGVRQTISTYFDAVNRQDYDTAWAQYTAQEQGRLGGEQQYVQGESSSHVSNVVIHSVTQQPDGTAQAVVTFTSTQNPSQSPDNQSCDNWSITYTMADIGGAWRIDNGTGANGTPYSSC